MARERRIAPLGVSSAVAVAACAVLAAATVAQERSEHVHQGFVFLSGADGSPQRAHVMYPRRPDGATSPAGERYPVVVALHGQGEARKRPDRGAIAWAVDYRLPEAYGALSRGRLERVDLRTYVSDEHLQLLNRELGARPFRGVMVVTPYVPDFMGAGPGIDLQTYGDWVAGPLLEAVRAQYPQAARSRDGTAIDGVSMGGWVALEVGFGHSEAFGAVGGIQPAVQGRTEALAAAARYGGRLHGPQHVRLLSSDADPFRGVTGELSGALRERRVPHTMTVVPGPHGYEFNRGPAAIELLRFADSVLNREAMP